MDLRCLCGSSGYSYKEWKGDFYPPKLKTGEMLSYYASKLPTVEINNTFYQLPKKETLEAWANQVPKEFEFVVKASRRITHTGRLSDSTRETCGFLLDNVRVLGPQLGAILFQLPPTMRLNLERLSTFLEHLPSDMKYAFEFRHTTWWCDNVYALLQKHNVALCVSDEEEERKCSPLQSTADFGYLRLRRAAYDDRALETWATKIKNQKWKRAYVFFKHEAINAPSFALKMLKRFEAR